MSDYWERRENKNAELMNSVRAANERRRVMMRLDNRIKRIKNDYLGQNDWRKVKIEIERRGGTWVAENGTKFFLQDNIIFGYTRENGISTLLLSAFDAPVPYIAELTVDMQFVQPGKRVDFLRELNKDVERKMKAEKEADIIPIVRHDWLTKISQKRWGTLDWKSHMKPTRATLDSPKRRGKDFDENLIYPGDTFEIIH